MSKDDDFHASLGAAVVATVLVGSLYFVFRESESEGIDWWFALLLGTATWVAFFAAIKAWLGGSEDQE